MRYEVYFNNKQGNKLQLTLDFKKITKMVERTEMLHMLILTLILKMNFNFIFIGFQNFQIINLNFELLPYFRTIINIVSNN